MSERAVSERARQPWQRRRDETGRLIEPKLWYERFWAWLQDPRRMMLTVYNEERQRKGKKSAKNLPGSWNKAVAAWDWRARAEAYDKHMEAERLRQTAEAEQRVLGEALAQRYGRIERLIELEKRLYQDLAEAGRLWPVEVRGEGEEVRQRMRFNSALVREYRGVLEDIAAELGHRKDHGDLVNVMVWSAEEWKKQAAERLAQATETADAFADYAGYDPDVERDGGGEDHDV